ncbi:MAG TPA: ArgE/DapE family deacylase [Desulfuromonadales bacterium]|nr:ArgE/DapE family deacylase [Desulfuromonadales bacterium]
MSLTPQQDRIIQAVAGLHDDILDLTLALVAQPSTIENQAGAVSVMEDRLRALGYPPVRVPVDLGRLAEHPGFAPGPWNYDGIDNLVAVRPADGEGGRSALFNGHLDVVSAEPAAAWSRDPYQPLIENGWLHGRGSGDMKSGVAAMTYAVKAIDAAGFGLNGPVTIETVVDEECCGNGALSCIAAGYDADAVLIPEPFGPTLYTAQVGVLWFKILIRGKPVHVLSAPAGTNAIEKSFPVIQALRDLEAEMNVENVPAAYAGLNHPLNLNIGIFAAGDWPSTVPAQAEIHGRMSYFPGTAFAEVAARIEATVAEAAAGDDWLREYPPEVSFYGFRSDGHTVSAEQPVLQTLADCHQRLTGEPPAEYISTCTTDLRAFHHFGRARGTCYGPVSESIHGVDERVRIDSVMQTAKAYALFLSEWCGLSE